VLVGLEAPGHLRGRVQVYADLRITLLTAFLCYML
jgi:hypothetical protein